MFDTTQSPQSFDPSAVAESAQRAVAQAAASLAHMDTAVTRVEAELAIARHHHVRRMAHDVVRG